MAEAPRAITSCLAWAELTCALLAALLWFSVPEIGPWPLILPLTCWMARLVWTGKLTRRTPFDLLIIFFLVTAGIGVWAAYDRQTAWSKFWLIVGGVCLFYAVVNAHSRIPEAGVRIAIGAGVGITLYFLATHDWTLFPVEVGILNSIGQGFQATLPPVPGPRLNSNEAGGLLAMLLPFAGWGTYQAWKRIGHKPVHQFSMPRLGFFLTLGALALMFIALAMSVSRGAWLALGVAVLLAVVWAGNARLGRTSLKRKVWVLFGLLALLLIISVGALILWQLVPVDSRSTLLSLDTWRNRRYFQGNSLTLVRDYPFTGSGLGGFQMLYSTYVMLIHVGFIADSHNLFLSIAIDQGLPALLSLIAMWSLFAVVAWRAIAPRGLSVDSTDPGQSLAGVAGLSLVVMLVHGIAENALYGQGVVLLFLPLAFAVQTDGKPSRKDLRLGAYALLICLGLPLGLILLQPHTTLSRAYSNLGSVHQSQAELSIYSWPEWVLQDEVRNTVDLDQSISEFEQALAWNPRNATANRRLAMIKLSQGHYEDALRHLEAAHAIEPESITTRQLLGEALIVNGRVMEGQAHWAGLSNEQKQLEIRAFWYEYLGDAERAAWIRQAAERP